MSQEENQALDSPDTKAKSETDDVFKDLLKDSGIASVSFTDQSLASFDAASFVREAAAPDSPEPRQKFGKRSARKKAAQSPASMPASVSFAPEQPDYEPVQEPGFMQAQIQAQEEAAARDQTEPYERATFVKPIAAQVVLDSVTVEDDGLDDETRQKEEALFAGFKEPGEADVSDELQEEEEVIDPSASLVDDYDYDLYEDKKRFMLTDYPKVEEYLSRQSRQGYHYIRHEGRKYYFHHGFPRSYYYQMLYFSQEPADSQMKIWESDGWNLLHRIPGRKKNEAGWFIMRNEQTQGSFRKEIENEEEKYRFFRSYSNSCRSTMFMLFICMVVCIIMGMLQYFFRGYLYGIVFAAVLFALSLWVFLIYGRMLRKSNKQVRLLKARLRLASREEAASQNQVADREDLEDEKHLDEDWDEMEKNQNSADKS